MTVIVSKPYRFVPPHRGNGWPNFIQRFRLVDRYLARHDGVVGHECRHLERLRGSLQAGNGILLAPNHCRYADPLTLGWPARELGIHVFAMASWHLFAKSRFDAFAIQKMGGFSIFREGSDRQSLDTAIEILVQGIRPLVLFPEGTTNRTNDILQPLLDGVAFIARTAAKKRAKQGLPPVVVHPVGIKYLFQGDIQQWGDRAASRLETALGWRPLSGQPLLTRVQRLAEAMLAVHEVRYLGQAFDQPLAQRRDQLIERLLVTAEQRCGLPADPQIGVLGRVRRLRVPLAAELCPPTGPLAAPPSELLHTIDAVELAQALTSFPDRYLLQSPITDTQVMETLERMQDQMFGKPDNPSPLKAVIEIGEAVEVSTERPARDSADPLMVRIQTELTSMLDRLTLEANVLS